MYVRLRFISVIMLFQAWIHWEMDTTRFLYAYGT